MAPATVTKDEPFAHLLSGAVLEPAGSICSIHGKQDVAFCAECDKNAPADVLEARKIGVAQMVGAVLTADVQAMIQKAVKQAIDEERAFQQWKATQVPQEGAPVASEGSPSATPPSGAPPPGTPPTPGSTWGKPA